MQGKPTEKLYLSDPYKVSFRAFVLSSMPLPQGNHSVVLDQTCFYPESGGQLADRGRLGGAEVVSVEEDEQGTVLHEVSQPVEVGEVISEVDWAVRFDHMQQHTGQHILSRTFVETLGAETVSFHMGEDTCTIDIRAETLEDRMLAEAENLSNAIVWENREVLVRNVSPSQLKSESFRKAVPPGLTSVRLVEIKSFDVCPCCGTHVRSTGELGIIKILKSEKVKGYFRVHFKVGGRALLDYQDKHEILIKLAGGFTTSVWEVSGKIEKLCHEIKASKKEIQDLRKKILAYDREMIMRRSRGYKGKRFIVYLFKDCNEGYLKSLSASIKGEENTVAILGSERGFVVCNASSDIQASLSEKVVEAAKRVGGSGGGRGVFASVGLPGSVDLHEFLEEVYRNVRDCL